MLGDVVGSFRLVRELGRGGMGTIWEAEHTLIGKRAAVKMLLPSKSSDRELVARFFNEARAAASIQHPGMVDVYDYGVTADGRGFLVMELLQGESLGTRLRREGRLPASLALEIVRQAASALAVAHQQEIVHRDLKPDNLFLVPDAAATCGARVKVLDFGIAKLSSRTETDARELTADGAIVGTPLYMSPEQCRGVVEVGPRADIYGLGAVLFHMLCGRAPFVRASVTEVLHAHLHDAIPLPRSLTPDLLPPVEGLVLSMLLKEPQARLPSMTALLAELEVLAPSAPGASARGSSRPAAGGAPRDDLSVTAPTVTPSMLTATAPGAPVAARAPNVVVGSPRTPFAVRRRRWIALAAAVIAAAAAIVAISLVVRGGDPDLQARCKQGDGSACVAAATLLEARVDVRAVGAELATLYDQGCEARSVASCRRLGGLHLRGFGVPRQLERAFGLFLRACDAGDAASCAQLGALYETGTGTRADAKKADALYARSCAAGSGLGCGGLAAARMRALDGYAALLAGRRGCALGAPLACYEAGRQLSFGLGVPPDEPAGLALLVRAVQLAEDDCRAGDPQACVILGTAYVYGRGVTLDGSRAHVAFQRACDLGDADGCGRLGDLLATGISVNKDVASAVRYLERGCDGGNPSACAALGFESAGLLGRAGDVARGRRILEELCVRSGDVVCWPLAFLYQRGIAVVKDETRALDLFLRACDAGSGEGCFYATRFHKFPPERHRQLIERSCQLGTSGGCEAVGILAYDAKDDAAALTSFRLACKLSTGTGCMWFARLYFEGRGVTRDPSRGVAILDESCAALDRDGCYALGERYRDGKDVAANVSRAFEYFEKSCAVRSADGCSAAATLTKDAAVAAELHKKGCLLEPKLCAPEPRADGSSAPSNGPK